MAQSIDATMAGLFEACQTVYANSVGPGDGQPVLVAFGGPGQYQPNAIVAVGWDLRLPIGRPTLGTNRSREQTAEIDIVISIYVPGGEEAAPVALASALSLQGLLETYLRQSPNETLGGGCRDSFVNNAHVAQSIAYQANDDPEILPVVTGRLATNTVTVEARIRY